MIEKIRKSTDTFKEIFAYYAVIIIIASTTFSYFEGKGIIESIWWSCVTAMTVGYGDVYPVTVGGKIVALFLMHTVPLIIVPLIITRLLNTVIVNENEFSHSEQEIMKNDIKEIKVLLKGDRQ